MEEKARGIILRTRPLTESSLIVHWLTAEVGRIATVAKGARRPKSPFAGKLDLFYEADLSFQRGRRSDLHTLREVSIRNAHEKLRQDIARVRQGCYFALLLEQSTEPETPLPEFHDLLEGALRALESAASNATILFGFELKLLRLLGYEPRLAALSPASRAAATTLLQTGLGAADTALTGTSSGELNRFLRAAIGTALERLPQQRQRALESLGVE